MSRPGHRPCHVGRRLPALRRDLPLHDRGVAGGVRRVSRTRGAGHGGVDGDVLLRVRRSACCARSATGSGRWWPRWRSRWRRRTGRPRRRATRSTPRRFCGRGDKGGKMQNVRYGARADQVNREIEAKKADIWSRGGHRRLRNRSGDRGRSAAAAARDRARAARTHHDHEGRDARAPCVRRRMDRRAGPPRGPARASTPSSCP